jgi:hypothetical protein
MKSYKVFEHPSGDMEAIKEDWSWTAFLFGWMWALCHGMWLVALGILGLGLLVAFGARGLGVQDSSALVVTALYGIVNSIVLGSIGNSLRASWQVGKGMHASALSRPATLKKHCRPTASAPRPRWPKSARDRFDCQVRPFAATVAGEGLPPHPSTPFAVPPIRPT